MKASFFFSSWGTFTSPTRTKRITEFQTFPIMLLNWMLLSDQGKNGAISLPSFSEKKKRTALENVRVNQAKIKFGTSLSHRGSFATV